MQVGTVCDFRESRKYPESAILWEGTASSHDTTGTYVVSQFTYTAPTLCLGMNRMLQYFSVALQAVCVSMYASMQTETHGCVMLVQMHVQMLQRKKKWIIMTILNSYMVTKNISCVSMFLASVCEPNIVAMNTNTTCTTTTDKISCLPTLTTFSGPLTAIIWS